MQLANDWQMQTHVDRDSGNRTGHSVQILSIFLHLGIFLVARLLHLQSPSPAQITQTV